MELQQVCLHLRSACQHCPCSEWKADLVAVQGHEERW
jgi:hypothetical protein